MRTTRRLLGLLALCSIAFCVAELAMASPASEAAVRSTATQAKAKNAASILAVNQQLAQPGNTPAEIQLLDDAVAALDACQVNLEPMLTFPN